MRLAIIGTMLLAGACSSANGEGGQAGANAGAGPGPTGGRQDFDVGAFEQVALEGPHNVVVTVGGERSVRAEGDREALERLDIRVEGDTLRVGTRRDGWFSSGRRMRAVTVHVAAPALRGASIGGSGDMRIDRVQSERFDAAIAGSGDMQIQSLQARRAEFSIAGSGNMRAAGAAEQAEISIAGSGDVELDSFEVRTASVTIMGSGNAGLRATQAVDGSIMGSGDLVVNGPARCSVSKMGSGNIRCGG